MRKSNPTQITMRLLLHLSIVFAILFISVPSSHSCNSIEKNALLQIKKSFNNPPELSTWNPRTDCCTDWNRVFCTNGRVTELDISSGNLPGRIPDQIGDLVYLRHLEITNMPHLSENIPRTITKLKNLDLLMLRETNLSGSIPNYISELKNLTFLDLAVNQFTGPIPGSISQMPKLETIRFNDNKLTGSVPNSFGSFVGNLTTLYLYNNKLSGKIPESLSNHDFNDVNLSGNRFIGDGSMFFGRNKTTLSVDLSKNKFEFDLSKVKFAKSIAFLHLSQNRIFGKLPGELTKLPLDQFNVSYNRLCGKIPQGGQLQTFEPSAFSHNLCLCGAPLKPC